MHLASASMPALPGAQYKSLHNGERAIAQHKACSLAPEPTTRIFIFFSPDAFEMQRCRID